MEWFNENRAFLRSSEDFPDLSLEELIAKQEKLMRELEKQANAPVRGRGRARGTKKGYDRGGKEMTPQQLNLQDKLKGKQGQVESGLKK